ncbi:MAG: transposase [Acidobacteria bacterium]|nr:transposase [Acidobacteriota bacterium]
MSRLKRLLLTSRIFFVTVNLLKNLPHFTDEEFTLLVAAIEESRFKLGFTFCGYVLMPDHWHALIGVSDPLTISRVVQDIKWISAGRLNRQRNRTGPFWQHQFWDRFVRHEKEFGHRLAYMHLNPVRKGLVKRPEDWKWSSYNNFALDRALVARCLIEIDCVDVLA